MSSSSASSQAGQFGPNEWLVEEMYQRFLDDPSAVDPAWHDFFADYKPAMAAGSIATPDESTAANATASAKRAGTDAPAAQHVLEKRTDVGWTLRAAERHEKDGIEWLGHEMVGL